MRVLGADSSIATFRHDLVYLEASLLADERPEISALAPAVRVKLSELRAERDRFETAEDASVVVGARKGRRDAALDKVVLSFGGHLRAVDRILYEVFFKPLSPSKIAQSTIPVEIGHVRRLLGEIDQLPADHPERSYQPELHGALEALVLAEQADAEADTSLALARSRVAQFKLATDRFRVEIFGELQKLLGNKKEADSFFRSTSVSPAADVDGDTPPAA